MKLINKSVFACSHIYRESSEVRFIKQSIFSLWTGKHFPNQQLLVARTCRQILSRGTQRTVKHSCWMLSMQNFNLASFHVPQNNLVLWKSLAWNKLFSVFWNNKIAYLGSSLDFFYNFHFFMTPKLNHFVRSTTSWDKDLAFFDPCQRFHSSFMLIGL